MDPANTVSDSDLEAANEEQFELERLTAEGADPEEEEDEEEEDDEEDEGDDDDADDEDEDEDDDDEEDDDADTDEDGNEIVKVREERTTDERTEAAPDVGSDRTTPIDPDSEGRRDPAARAALAIREIENLEDDAKGG